MVTDLMTQDSDSASAAKPDRARRGGDDRPCEPGRRLGNLLLRERRDLDERGSLLADRVVLTRTGVGLDPEGLLRVKEVRRDLTEVLDRELEAGVRGGRVEGEVTQVVRQGRPVAVLDPAVRFIGGDG